MAKATQRSSALTDTHLVLLSAAARHPKGALTRPERMAARQSPPWPLNRNLGPL